MPSENRLNVQIVDEAAQWAEALDGGVLPLDQRQAFLAWLRKSPDHIYEFLEASAIIRAFSEIDPEREISIDALLAEAGADVVSLSHSWADDTISHQSLNEKRSHQGLRLSRSTVAIAASIMLFLVVSFGLLANFGGNSFRNDNEGIIYATIVGEQRSIPLSDGSVVSLNTASKVRIRFEGAERNIDLLEGEAMFEVAHDPSRPFRVQAGETVTEAIGTTFNVYRKPDVTTIAVIEGKVAVTAAIRSDDVAHDGSVEIEGIDSFSPPSGLAHPIEQKITLVAGERAAVRKNGVINHDRVANTDSLTSWRLRRLVFESEALSAIVDEYNRYNQTQLIVDNPELAATRLSGVFDIDDPRSLVAFLELSTNLEAIESSPNLIRLVPKEPTIRK